VSPGDPVFYLHHAQIDRVWAIWQNLDPPNRQNTIFGTGTFQNIPPSANVTMDDYVSVGVLNEPKKVRELLSTVAGPFCYVYV
jgi:tyrosinase